MGKLVVKDSELDENIEGLIEGINFDPQRFYNNYFLRTPLDIQQWHGVTAIEHEQTWHKLSPQDRTAIKIDEVNINRDDSFNEIQAKFQLMINSFHSMSVPFRLSFHLEKGKVSVYISLIDPFFTLLIRLNLKMRCLLIFLINPFRILNLKYSKSLEKRRF